MQEGLCKNWKILTFLSIQLLINKTIALTHQRFYVQKQFDYNAD